VVLSHKNMQKLKLWWLIILQRFLSSIYIYRRWFRKISYGLKEFQFLKNLCHGQNMLMRMILNMQGYFIKILRVFWSFTILWWSKKDTKSTEEYFYRRIRTKEPFVGLLELPDLLSYLNLLSGLEAYKQHLKKLVSLM
jgi:hypothetical protein